MLQLMDLARENAALRRELERVRQEAKALRLLLRKRTTQSTPSGQVPLIHLFVRVSCQAGGRMESRVSSRAAGDDSPGGDSARMATILAELNLNPNTDLASLVERVYRNNLSWIVVPALALAAWEQRDSSGWAKVLTWLETKGVIIVRI